MNWNFIIILSILNIPLYLYIGKLFFEDWHGFFEAVKYWLTPQFISALRGKYWEDIFSEFKLFFYFGCCALIVSAEYQILIKFFV